MASHKPDPNDDRIWRALGGDVRARETSDHWETLMNVLDRRPATNARDRLLTSLTAGSGITSYAERVAVFLDIETSLAHDELVDLAANQERWFDYHTAPGLQISQVCRGPRHTGRECFVVRFVPGAQIPMHGHQGDEWGFVLQGNLSDSRGFHNGPGDITHLTPADTHRIWNPGPTVALAINIIDKGYIWK